MSARKGATACYEFDENGKIKVLPMQIPLEFQMKDGSSGKKRRHTRQLKLEPLNLNPAALKDSPESAAKVKKVVKNAKKGLFNIPQSPLLRLQSQRTFSKTSSFVSRKSNIRNSRGITTSPEDDDVQMGTKRRRILSAEGYPFKSPSKPVINFIKHNKQMVKFGADSKKKTSDNETKNDSPNTAFINFEKACATPKTVKPAPSPLTHLCNLRRDTNLSVIEESITSINMIDMPNINIIIQDLEALLAEETRQFHGRMLQIRHIIDNLKTLEEQNKENVQPNPRSEHLLAKCQWNSPQNTDNSDMKSSGSKSSQSKPITSPSIKKSIDLRKTPLRKMFAQNMETMIMTPRLNKAVSMYNSMRSEFSILCTPKLNEKGLNSPTSGNESLSDKLQKQCLLLQETPVHE